MLLAEKIIRKSIYLSVWVDDRRTEDVVLVYSTCPRETCEEITLLLHDKTPQTGIWYL